MDPLSITTALLAFIEIGVRIKQVVDKVSLDVYFCHILSLRLAILGWYQR